MGIGSSSGENRAVEAAKMAIASPLLELSIDGAKGILFTVTGSPDLSMYEVAEAAKVITGSADDDAKVIFGANIDEELKDEVRITVVATGFDNRDRRTTPTHAGDVSISPKGSWKPMGGQARAEAIMERNQPLFEQRRVPSTAPIQSQVGINTPLQSQGNNDDDDDLGIPAFIRRKMM